MGVTEEDSEVGSHFEAEQQQQKASPGNGGAAGQEQGTEDSLLPARNGVNSTSVPATDSLRIDVPTDNVKNRRWSKVKKPFKVSPGCIATAIISVAAAAAIFATIIYLAVEHRQLNLEIDECKLQLAAYGRGTRPCPPGWIWYQKRCYYFSKEEGNWTASQDFCSLHNASLAVIGKEEMEFVRRYKGKVPHWIGLKRDPDETQTRPWKWIGGSDSTLEVEGEGGDCAFLNDDATASSSRCRTAHHWICSKPDELTSR